MNQLNHSLIHNYLRKFIITSVKNPPTHQNDMKIKQYIPIT